MEQVITVNTQSQFNRVVHILSKKGYNPLPPNVYLAYAPDVYIAISQNHKTTLFFGSTSGFHFSGYELDGIVVSYEDFIKSHPMTQAIATKLFTAKVTKDLQKDNVNHPNHYNSYSREVIDTLQGSMTPDEFKGYLKGNIMKYVTRYQFKNGVEDLKKAKWYIEKLTEVVDDEI